MKTEKRIRKKIEELKEYIENDWDCDLKVGGGFNFYNPFQVRDVLRWVLED